MKTLDICIHLTLLVVFITCGYLSGGEVNTYAIIATCALLIEGMMWTGLLGSLIALIKGTK